MNYHPYPDADRALAQVERGRAPEPDRCPVCTHFVSRHALEDGTPVCTRGVGLVSCRDCAETWAQNPTVAALTDLGRVLQLGSGRQVLAEHPRRTGKTAITAAVAEQALRAGEHVHVSSRDGVRCAGGDPACPLPRYTPDRPIALARVVRTCNAVPSQWNAWTVDGQYLYLRYRSGTGTVDAYDTEDSAHWPRIPDGAVARFDTGDRHDGEMDLTEFCERAGLQIAEDAEVTGE
ncbi:hypothetical protein [Streptomyces beihaiensis]|uniref:HNH endonuclease n=1 Tax=Streptomyces beihaiensis TaxID=2984495 RepID=A0ABT3TRA0_9ACTN|nr:hypothetical protein [Streptomyces beihaiensis]MCX3059569.1 hypothetical protein [Streptomyces beihaiensis]